MKFHILFFLSNSIQMKSQRFFSIEQEAFGSWDEHEHEISINYVLVINLFAFLIIHPHTDVNKKISSSSKNSARGDLRPCQMVAREMPFVDKFQIQYATKSMAKSACKVFASLLEISIVYYF